MDFVVSLTPGPGIEPLQAIAEPPAHASVVEVRSDLFPDLDLRPAISSCPLPVLVTYRSTREGGKGTDDPRHRRSLLAGARDAGAALLDLEYERDAALVDDLGLEPERVVLSWHDPTGTPAHLAETCDAMMETPARWIKVVPTACALADVEVVLDLHRRFNSAKARHRRVITFAMGAVGVPTRYLAPLLGPPLVFVSWNARAPAAPGQLTTSQHLAVTEHLKGGPQRLYGVVGADVTGSSSPALHSAGYRACALPYLFLPFTVPEPGELGELFLPRGHGLLARVGLDPWGWAVTSPYKERAAQAADVLAPRVRAAHAANTLILRTRHLIAENTDADGVTGALTTFDVSARGRLAVVQGTGGAARGAAIGLYNSGATVVLRGRDAERTRTVAALLGVDWCAPGDFPETTDIVINATPLGARPDDPLPFSPAELRGVRAVVDMVYAEQPTALAEICSGSGATLVDGVEVLAHQGYAQFAAFTGKIPPREAMHAAVRGSG